MEIKELEEVFAASNSNDICPQKLCENTFKYTVKIAHFTIKSIKSMFMIIFEK
jgi:hypothetical protein